MQRHSAPLTPLSRRRILALAAAMAGGAALAACGNLAATETPNPAASNPPPVAHTAGIATTAAAAMPAPVNDAATVGTAFSGTQSGGQTLVIEAFDFGYKTLASVPGGFTTVRMMNTGQEAHHTQFVLLNAGVTFDQFTTALQKGLGPALALGSVAGGPGLAAPNGTAEVMLDLQPGQYAIACFAQGADHLPHVAKGMVMPLTVTAPAMAAIPASNPATVGTITLFDFSFEMPATLPAGRNLYRVVNGGAQFHEFTVIQIAPGKTLADVKAFFDPPPNAPAGGPPPGLPVGGMNALSKGSSGIAVLDLSPGEYAAICNVPDQSHPNGDSHLHLGMMKGFTVA